MIRSISGNVLATWNCWWFPASDCVCLSGSHNATSPLLRLTWKAEFGNGFLGMVMASNPRTQQGIAFQSRPYLNYGQGLRGCVVFSHNHESGREALCKRMRVFQPPPTSFHFHDCRKRKSEIRLKRLPTLVPKALWGSENEACPQPMS